MTKNITENKFVHLDNYKSYMLDILHLTPQVRGTNLYNKLKANFADFDCTQGVFYKYLKQLREDNNLLQFARRIKGTRVPPKIGVESQVDFGQFKIKNFYGSWEKVHFFCMALSYSNFRYCYFQKEQFTTATAIKAHKLAFAYFGGRTRQIMYDIDAVFANSFNYGDLVLVKEFEDYAKSENIELVFCKPRDPDTKGGVEQLVNFIKEGFLVGRVYTGIDSLNKDCLHWLDTVGNESLVAFKPYNPREMFRQESKFLIPVAPLQPDKIVYMVYPNNTINYKGIDMSCRQEQAYCVLELK